MSVQEGDWVVVVISDLALPGDGAQPGQLCYLEGVEEEEEEGLPFRVSWHTASGRRRYWWCQSVRPATPEELASAQLTSLPGGQL